MDAFSTSFYTKFRHLVTLNENIGYTLKRFWIVLDTVDDVLWSIKCECIGRSHINDHFSNETFKCCHCAIWLQSIQINIESCLKLLFTFFLLLNVKHKA